MKWPLDDATNLKENTKNQKELLTLVDLVSKMKMTRTCKPKMEFKQYQSVSKQLLSCVLIQ